MKQYKCSNCDYTWETQDEPFECPKCHSASVMELGGKQSVGDVIKKFWWIIVAAVVVAALAIILMPKNATTVKVDVEPELGRMVVTLKGKHASEYIVMVKQNNNIEKQASTVEENPVIFNDLRGDYVLGLMYVGQGSMPKVRKFQSEYSFGTAGGDDPAENPDGGLTPARTPKPEIVELSPSPKRIAEGGTYTVTVKLSPNGCPVDNAEFSMNGTDWQSSPVFSNLSDGEYDFYVRNKKLTDLVTDRGIVLAKPYSGECLTVDKANSLLRRIADNDRKAKEELERLAGRDALVNGAEFEKTVAAMISRVRQEQECLYVVTAVDCSGGLVKSITVRKK